MTRFIVAVEDISYEFAQFTSALECYNCLIECGFHEATLRAVDKYGEALVWSPSVGAFFPCEW